MAIPETFPSRLFRSSSSRSDSFLRHPLTARTQSSISSGEDALTRNVRLEVTIPNAKECFFMVTGATVWTDLSSMTLFSEYSWI